MNRIESIFAALRADGRQALMPFVTAGHPTLDATAAILPALEEAGASVCELGIPFSDPVADGPVIQASMTSALSHDLHVDEVFEMVRGVRDRLSIGLVAMVSYSIVYRIGVERFVKGAAGAGFDGFIFPDLPLEEADAVSGPVKDAGMICSLLIAPPTPVERAERIAAACSGFIYMVSRTGITGESAELPADLVGRVAHLRGRTDLPIAVGFGISGPKQVRTVTAVADAAIVGSAVVRRINEHQDEGAEAIAGHVGGFVGELARGLGR
ncbi:MAG: tryptophan synthase subunit alpha [Planctomycetaceae bacterium]|nr:tryptophan synthase subunit alpha [Planctomycetaceae bacterium]